ncbi:hypothetical protein DCC81_12850 [Chitinophaga parva]|uniref:Uncharacterized protein n=1 Tax=Chitinophaga parva TaxID=2169414 RepID=A0A2T7BFY2_9BACT|nr:hypothetical protein DCC81_12850 [Chitinophaga parva]
MCDLNCDTKIRAAFKIPIAKAEIYIFFKKYFPLPENFQRYRKKCMLYVANRQYAVKSKAQKKPLQ